MFGLRTFTRVARELRHDFALIQDEHRRIYEAIRDAQPGAAREAMRRHLTRSLERYRKLAAERQQAA